MSYDTPLLSWRLTIFFVVLDSWPILSGPQAAPLLSFLLVLEMYNM